MSRPVIIVAKHFYRQYAVFQGPLGYSVLFRESRKAFCNPLFDASFFGEENVAFLHGAEEAAEEELVEFGVA